MQEFYLRDLLEVIDSSDSVFYVILNPDDNSVYRISSSLAKMTDCTDYEGKQLREVLGCSEEEDCANSAVRLDMSHTDKVIHIVNCEFLGRQFFVLKFKAEVNGSQKHLMICSDANSFSSNTLILNNLDSIISHEVKNALNNLNLINTNLLESMSEPELEQFSELLELSNQNISVVEKILRLYAEIKKTILTNSYLSKCGDRICQVVREAVTDCEALRQSRRLKVCMNVPEKGCEDCRCAVQYNKGLLYLLFSNLVNNAFKYAPSGSEIMVDFRHCGGEITVCIENEGVLSKEVARDFFTKYVKGENSSGTGYGTYCCKLIADLCKGRLEMNDSDEKVRLTVTLPS